MCLMYTKCIPNFWEISMEDPGWDTLTMGKFLSGEARSDGAAQLVAASMMPVDGPGAAAALEQLAESVCWPAAESEHRSSRPAESDPRASLEPARAAIAASDRTRWRQECCGMLQLRRCSSSDPLRQARGLAGWSLQERSRRSMGVERMLLSCARQLSARISGGSACVACSDTCTCTCDSTCVVSWKCLHSSRDGS